MKKYNIVVLINDVSASASEVLAAALNEQLGAPLIGTTTYGKGTVQKTKELTDGSLIKYTIEIKPYKMQFVFLPSYYKSNDTA